jgi:surface antigen
MSRSAAAKLAPFVLALFVFSGCASLQQEWEENPKAVLGTVIGVAAGAGIAAAAGGGAGWIVGGAALGGLLGGAVGHGLDERDKRLAHQAAVNAFENYPSGQSSVWNNPDNGHSGSITPTQTYQIASGQYCRRYTQTIDIGGTPQQSAGTACRQSDGTWKIQS